MLDKPVLIDEHELRQGLEHQPGDLVLEQEDVLLMLGLWIASSGSAAPPQRLAVHHVLQQEAVVGAMERPSSPSPIQRSHGNRWILAPHL